MSAGQILGAVIVALAAVGLVGSTVVTMGWREAFCLWGFAVTFATIVTLGVALLSGEVTP